MILLILSVLVPILLIDAFIYHARFRSLREQELQANLEVARAVAKAFEAFVQDVIHQELAIGLAITSRHPLGVEDITRLLSSHGDYAAIRDFSWVNPEGIFVYSSNPAMVGADNNDRSYFRDIAEGRDWTVGELILARTTGQPVFGISRGIRDDKGDLLGVVVATVIPEQLDSVLSVERGRGGGLALVDENGMLVYRYPSIRTTWEERNWLEQYPQFKEVLGGKEIAATIYAPYEKKNRMVGFTPIPSIGWAVTAGRTEEVALEAAVSSLLYNAILFFAVAMAAFACALVFSRRISASVRDLRDHALAVGRGEAREPIPAMRSGPAEIAELAEAFNTMAEKVFCREGALRENEQLLRRVVDSMPIGIWITDKYGNIYMGNPAGQQIWAGKRYVGIERFREYKAWWLDTGKRVEPDDWAIARAIRHGQTSLNEELEIECFDGTRRIILNSALPVLDEKKNPIGAIAINQDITARKRMEEDLRRSRNELEQRVQERTAELKGYMAKLEQSNQALQDFASIASHDLQEPLRKVSSFGRRLKQKYADPLGPEGNDYIDRMLSATARMNSLLKALLEYARLTSRAEPFREVDLSEIVREVLLDLEVRIETTRGRVDVEALPVVEADPTQMRQLFQNLIGNALKFHKESESPLINVRCAENGDGQYRIVVEDNGIGFEEQYIERVFAPFHRLHGRSSPYEGTGMGLAICKKIVERHGGSITAESEPGKGSTFIVRLPYKKPQTV